MRAGLSETCRVAFAGDYDAVEAACAKEENQCGEFCSLRARSFLICHWHFAISWFVCAGCEGVGSTVDVFDANTDTLITEAELRSMTAQFGVDEYSRSHGLFVSRSGKGNATVAINFENDFRGRRL